MTNYLFCEDNFNVALLPGTAQSARKYLFFGTLAIRGYSTLPYVKLTMCDTPSTKTLPS